jgi:hypothetical protein
MGSLRPEKISKENRIFQERYELICGLPMADEMMCS